MKSSEIRQKFLDYFKEKGHEIVPSSSLIPLGDATLLFTNAGMVQFKSLFLGQERRDYKRATTSQKCVRAGGKHNDLENVGRTARHHTFFEMLGNFSFGDYFKEGAIEFGWQFLTERMGLPKDKLWITVYTDDDEAEKLWHEKAGVPLERIARLGEKDNFWSMGDTGPCGPCSEIHIDQGPEVGCGRAECSIECDCGRYLEIWNLVFMQYNRDESGKLTPLERPSIDTGMGLERLAAVMQGKTTNYDTDLFVPLIEFIEKLSGAKYGVTDETDVSIRAIADHARAVTFLITDGILPSNEGRGYVLRRILRRAVRHGKFIGFSGPFLHKVNEEVIALMGEAYPETIRAREIIERATKSEEERFFETLERGLEILDEEIAGLGDKKELSGETAFKLYDTFGFPLDLTADILRDKGITIDEAAFETAMEGQRTRARSAWKGADSDATGDLYKELSGSGISSEFVGYDIDIVESAKLLTIIKDGEVVERANAGDTVSIITDETPFYGESGGQAGDTGLISTDGVLLEVTDTLRPLPGLIVHNVTIKNGTISSGDEIDLQPDMDRRAKIRRNHTATHVLHALLRKTLGDHVRQAGSLVNEKALRFDFNHFEAVTTEQLREIENKANRVIMSNYEVTTDLLSYDEAVERGALAFFEEKYADDVRMVSVGDQSIELCGGTHVTRSGDIGPVKIIGESSVAAGVRRIEAVTGEEALRRSDEAYRILTESSSLVKSSPAELSERITRLLKDNKEKEREIKKLKSAGPDSSTDSIMENLQEVAGVKVIASLIEGADSETMRESADSMRKAIGSGIVVLGAECGGKAMLLCAVTRDLTDRFRAGDIIKKLAPIVGGGGGGKPELAQAGGKDPSKLKEAIKAAAATIEQMS